MTDLIKRCQACGFLSVPLLYNVCPSCGGRLGNVDPLIASERAELMALRARVKELEAQLAARKKRRDGDGGMSW